MIAAIIDTETNQRIAAGDIPLRVTFPPAEVGQPDNGVAVFSSVGQIEPAHAPRYKCVEQVLLTPAPSYPHVVVEETHSFVNGRDEVTRIYAPVAPEEISDRQFFQQLAISGSITTQEALDAVKTGAIPAAISAVVDALPDDQKFSAQMLLSGATVFKRSHPMTAALGAGLGLSSEQIDAIWIAASQL